MHYRLNLLILLLVISNIVKYVYSGFKCKLLIIGDSAQLPPIKSNISYALNEKFLKEEYDKKQLDWKNSN